MENGITPPPQSRPGPGRDINTRREELRAIEEQLRRLDNSLQLVKEIQGEIKAMAIGKGYGFTSSVNRSVVPGRVGPGPGNTQLPEIKDTRKKTQPQDSSRVSDTLPPPPHTGVNPRLECHSAEAEFCKGEMEINPKGGGPGGGGDEKMRNEITLDSITSPEEFSSISSDDVTLERHHVDGFEGDGVNADADEDQVDGLGELGDNSLAVIRGNEESGPSLIWEEFGNGEGEADVYCAMSGRNTHAYDGYDEPTLEKYDIVEDVTIKFEKHNIVENEFMTGVGNNRTSDAVDSHHGEFTHGQTTTVMAMCSKSNVDNSWTAQQDQSLRNPKNQDIDFVENGARSQRHADFDISNFIPYESKNACTAIALCSTLQNLPPPSLVLQKVFKYLDQPTLGLCRRVCKNWNQTAIPVYSQHWVDFGFYYRKFDFSQTTLLESWKTTMMQAAPGLIRKLKIQFCFLRLTVFQQFFTTLGSFLTSLVINGPFSKHIVFMVLMSCPNLEKFAVGNLTALIDDVQPSRFQPLFLSDLKLRELEFVGSVTPQNQFPTTSFFANDANVHFLIEIVRASPQLSTLITDFGDNFNSFSIFVRGIAPYQRVTRNLVKWVIGEFRRMPPLIRHIEPLQVVEFSDKFKYFHFRNILDSIIWCRRENGALVLETFLERILQKVSDSLETLILSGPYFAAPPRDGSQIGLVYQINLPRMKNLKNFQNRSMDQFRLFSLAFVQKFPNLEKLLLYSASPEFFRYVFQHPENVSVAQNPHLNLRELRLTQALALPSEIMVVAKIFPNLTKLCLSFGIAVVDGMEHLSLKSSLQVLQNLPHLQSLGLELLGLYDPVKIHEEFVDVFQHLCCLKSFALISNVGHEARKRQPLLRQILFKSTVLFTMCQAKRLQSLTLVNVMMPLEDAASLKEILQSNNIRLNFEEDDCNFSIRSELMGF